MPNQWYALRSKPRKEDVVWRQLRLDGVEVFYPRLRVNPVNPRSKKIKPYFPGYLFVYIDIEQTGISRFQWMPHTIGLVSFGGEPAHVPENLIIELQKRVAEIAEAGGEVFDGLKAGDKVRISNGPFQGYEAIFDARVSGTERVRVLLELLTNKRRVPIELSSGSIEKKKK
jgi:transcription antitermination factor NusG